MEERQVEEEFMKALEAVALHLVVQSVTVTVTRLSVCVEVLTRDGDCREMRLV